MSVDQRIREGLHTTSTQLPEPDTHRALNTVTTRARTATRRRGLIAGGLAAAAAAAAAVVAVSLTGDDNARQPLPADRTPTQSPDPAPLPGRTLSEEELEWGYAYLSDPVTFDEMAQTLRKHGLNEWVEPLHEKWGDVDGQIQLDLNQGQLTASIPGTPVSHTDSYLVFRDFLTLGDADLEATARELAAGGQQLTLTLPKWDTSPDTAPTVDGIPREVYVRALYTTVPFNELPSPFPADLSPGTYESDPVRFHRIASDLRDENLSGWVEPLRERWSNADEPVQIRLELDGDTATLSIPGTQITFTGPYTTDGSLIRIEDANPQDDNGWIELASRPDSAGSDTVYFYTLWDAGPAAWSGLPAEVIVATLFHPDRVFTPTGE